MAIMIKTAAELDSERHLYRKLLECVLRGLDTPAYSWDLLKTEIERALTMGARG